MLKFIHEITEADVKDCLRGPLSMKIGFVQITNMMGKILPVDVGKRVYKVKCNDGASCTYQVENNAQRNERITK